MTGVRRQADPPDLRPLGSMPSRHIGSAEGGSGGSCPGQQELLSVTVVGRGREGSFADTSRRCGVSAGAGCTHAVSAASSRCRGLPVPVGQIVAAIAQAWGIARPGVGAWTGGAAGEPRAAAELARKLGGTCTWFRTGMEAAAGAPPAEATPDGTWLAVMERSGVAVRVHRAMRAESRLPGGARPGVTAARGAGLAGHQRGVRGAAARRCARRAVHGLPHRRYGRRPITGATCQ